MCEDGGVPPWICRFWLTVLVEHNDGTIRLDGISSYNEREEGLSAQLSTQSFFLEPT
ncbi:hypothetical protein KSB_32510 [Ktedonobacter robiniae]|uniref:Uncharacterized protein n=1 Tax=Ktedonobacter robiniae TaxID=2778365 RepID=A0ABQ3UPW4_9CHLR|nr:hypothetical protein KSB_32510 [Ktedonobacter robiniae]